MRLSKIVGEFVDGIRKRTYYVIENSNFDPCMKVFSADLRIYGSLRKNLSGVSLIKYDEGVGEIIGLVEAADLIERGGCGYV
jgi:hypothetical protein